MVNGIARASIEAKALVMSRGTRRRRQTQDSALGMVSFVGRIEREAARMMIEMGLYQVRPGPIRMQVKKRGTWSFARPKAIEVKNPFYDKWSFHIESLYEVVECCAAYPKIASHH